MPTTDTYEAIASLYDTDVAWAETVTLGSRSALNVAAEALEATERPDATAVRIVDLETDTQTTATFSELDAAANRVANYLTATTAPGDRVAAALPVSLELYAVLYGTIKAGRIYVPVSPDLDAEGSVYRLTDAGAGLLVTTSDLLDGVDLARVPSLERTVVVGATNDRVPSLLTAVDPYATVREQSSEFETVACHPHDPYAISYTSGTTGDPKGCLQTHGKFVRKTYPHVAWVTGLGPGDTYMTGASPTTRQDRPIATHVWDATIANHHGEFDPAALLETLESIDVTALHITPSGLRQLRAADPAVEHSTFDLSSLVTGGEPLDDDTIEWARETLGAPPQEGYGLTEIGMVVCNYAFDDWEIKPGSLGRPLPGLTVEVHDEEGRSVEPGDVGELVVELPPDFAGWYWGKPEQSVAGFHGTWYRTGDLVRMDEDGYVWYVTRKSAAIHAHGALVAPAEIEAALLGHEAVAEAGVAGVPDEAGDERITAAVSLTTEEAAVDADDVLAYAESVLPPHQRPHDVEIVDELPKTSTGKIRRSEL